EPARRTVRTTRAIEQTGKRAAGLLTGPQPALPPAVGRRRRHTEGGRGSPHRQSLLDRLDQRDTASQSELGVSVQIHPRPPLSVSPGRPTASKEGRIEPQPFTTCVGGTPSRLRDPAGRASSSESPLDQIRPTPWPDEYTI